jgi:hypothetical protein
MTNDSRKAEPGGSVVGSIAANFHEGSPSEGPSFHPVCTSKLRAVQQKGRSPSPT